MLMIGPVATLSLTSQNVEIYSLQLTYQTVWFYNKRDILFGIVRQYKR